MMEIGGDATHLATGTDGPASRRYDGGTAAARVHAAVIADSDQRSTLVDIPAVSAVVAADWLRLDGGMET